MTKKSGSRGAGRPKIIKNVPPVQGLLEKPKDPNNLIEFVYSFPTSIKYIWQIFKRMNAAKNYITFYADRVEILSHSHNKKSAVRCSIDCKNISEYFCEEKTSIVVDCSHFVNITKKIDSKVTNFQMYLQKTNTYSIIVKLTPLGGPEEQYDLSLTDEYDADLTLMHQVPEYTIKIQTGCKYWKRTVTEIKKNVKLMTFVQESNTSPVILQWMTDDDSINVKYEFQKKNTDDKKDQQSMFTSELQDNNVFRVMFRTEYMKPFGTSMPNDTIDIYLHEEHPLKMMLESQDKAIIIEIFISTEFTNY